MESITKKQLENQIAWLNRLTGKTFELGWANGGVRIEHARDRNITKRLTRGEMSDQLLSPISVLTRMKADGDRNMWPDLN
jgi:hypothetical protein